MNLPNQLQCIIFDMDGVIIDSEEIHKKAYYETFISIGVDVSDQLYKTLTGSSTINAFQKLVSHFNLDLNPEELVLIKREKYVNFFENDPTIHLVKGVEEFIKHSFNKGYTLILASSSAMVNIDRVFNRKGIHTHPFSIISDIFLFNYNSFSQDVLLQLEEDKKNGDFKNVNFSDCLDATALIFDVVLPSSATSLMNDFISLFSHNSEK